MAQTNHIVWDANPVAFNLGTIHLPFPVAIWGIVAALVFIYLGYQKMVPDDLAKNEEADIPALKFWGLVIVSFVVGQLIFFVLPSPTISSIGPIRPRWYGVLFAASFVTGYILTRRMFQDSGRTEEEVDSLLTYVIIATVVGARLGHVIFYDLMFYLRHPAEIIAIWHGGLASHGAAIGIIIAMYLYVKKKPNMSFLWLADRVVVVVAIAGAFIRVGNFFNSEIIGKPSNLPWAIIFERVDMVPRHPSMLYEALLCLVTFSLLWYIYKRYEKHPPEGSMFSVFLVFLFGGRFWLEFYKHHQAAFTGGWEINMGQILSIPLVLIGLWLMIKKVNWKKNFSINSKTNSKPKIT